MRRGVVYAWSHRNWIAETIRSSLSFARHMPDLERHLFIPATLRQECQIDLGDEGPSQPFTRIVSLERIAYSHRPRFESMLRLELDQVIFIDGDPPGLFRGDALDAGLYQAICPTADDLWLYWMALRSGAICRKVGPRRTMVLWPGTQRVNLNQINVNQHGNDRQIGNLIARFGFPGL